MLKYKMQYGAACIHCTTTTLKWWWWHTEHKRFLLM